jgi:hypothetical protein
MEAEAPGVEGEGQTGPLKICRHCSVASRTEAAECPACGKPYARQFNWKVWAVLAIIVTAFFVGFGVRKLLQGDDEGAAATITLEQEGAAPELDGVDQVLPAPSCIYYPITDDEENIWEFCFQEDVLVSSSSVGG